VLAVRVWGHAHPASHDGGGSSLGLSVIKVACPLRAPMPLFAGPMARVAMQAVAVAWYHLEQMKTRPAWAGSAGFDSVSCRRSARSDNLGAATYDQCGGRTPAGLCAPPPEEDP
jgi:hypothetical protein